MAYLIAGVAIYLAFRFKRQRDQHRAEINWLLRREAHRADRAREINPTNKIDVVL